MEEKLRRIQRKITILRIFGAVIGSFIAFLTVVQVMHDGGSLLNILPGLPNKLYDLLASNPG